MNDSLAERDFCSSRKGSFAQSPQGHSVARRDMTLLFIRMFAFKDTHTASRFPQKSRQITHRCILTLPR